MSWSSSAFRLSFRASFNRAVSSSCHTCCRHGESMIKSRYRSCCGCKGRWWMNIGGPFRAGSGVKRVGQTREMADLFRRMRQQMRDLKNARQRDKGMLVRDRPSSSQERGLTAITSPTSIMVDSSYSHDGFDGGCRPGRYSAQARTIAYKSSTFDRDRNGHS